MTGKHGVNEMMLKKNSLNTVVWLLFELYYFIFLFFFLL